MTKYGKGGGVYVPSVLQAPLAHFADRDPRTDGVSHESAIHHSGFCIFAHEIGLLE